jgi:hypothetical protein
MDAVLAVITEQGLSPTPTAIFAAVLASLEHADTRQSPEARRIAPASSLACASLSPAARVPARR